MNRNSSHKIIACLMVFILIIVLTNAYSNVRLLELVSLALLIALVPVGFFALFTNLRSALMGVTAIAIGLSVWTTNWPAKARFFWARSKFETLVDEVENGRTVEVPRWVGTYRVQQVRVNRKGAICFWTDVASGGNSGIVKCTEPQMNFNLWSHIPLDSDWRVIAED